MKFESNYNLRSLNTFKLNSQARFFVELNRVEDLHEIYDFAMANNVSIRILGGGSNLILPEHIEALVIKNNLTGSRFTGEETRSISIACASGVNWHSFVLSSIGQGLFGLENLALIPGTVGGAPIQNIGAYGVEVNQFITKVTGYDFDTNTIKALTNPECQFEYRHSIFKTPAYKNFLITEVEFKLLKHAQPVLSYAELAQAFARQPNVQARDIANKVIQIRQRKLPDVQTIPNVGSFFKNPITNAQTVSNLKVKFPDLVVHTLADGQFKLAAGQLIDKLGFKGRRHGTVAMYEKQALVMINLGEARLIDVKKMTDLVQQECLTQLGILLETEPIFW
ncbi:MAG: UDP-N-acetylmuramate dehydrogenase [Bdellovibrionaceae bacterium]|nr:UDP-N-acetylmuramate dehydrogenase [Pseudobdellovibrionaceae bacterium]